LFTAQGYGPAQEGEVLQVGAGADDGFIAIIRRRDCGPNGGMVIGNEDGVREGGSGTDGKQVRETAEPRLACSSVPRFLAEAVVASVAWLRGWSASSVGAYNRSRMNEPPRHDVTELLGRIGRKDEAATDTLLPLLYDELRALARGCFGTGTPGETLQPTALVHEAYLKLTRNVTPDWQSRAHFMAVAARAMRQILANHAESKRALKRGAGRPRVTLSGVDAKAVPAVDLIDLDEALGKLAELSPDQARIVEMRFLAGVEVREIGAALDMSERTVRRKWRMARAFLECELGGDGFE